MEAAINFTVIIPHKNIPVLLERLVKSIPERNDLEIIIVDDNSDSDIVDFEHFPCRGRNNYFLILNKESHGAGYARNCALPMAKGKWILFADADDFFNSGFDTFLNDYIDCDAEIVYFNANSVDSESFEPSDRVDHLHEFIDEYHKDKNRGELIMRYLFTEPWCKMVKREIIEQNQIRFEETSIRNDVKYSYLVGFYANRVIVDDRQLYCVTTRRNSVSRGIGYQASLDELKVFAGWKNFFIKHNIPLDLPKFDYRAYNFARHLYKNNQMFRKEYCILRDAHFEHAYIIKLVLRYLWKSLIYKLG
jgi:glycosyltransferase involved in cell wall biosynthesis